MRRIFNSRYNSAPAMVTKLLIIQVLFKKQFIAYNQLQQLVQVITSIQQHFPGALRFKETADAILLQLPD
jgi:hypothetical protein